MRSVYIQCALGNAAVSAIYVGLSVRQRTKLGVGNVGVDYDKQRIKRRNLSMPEIARMRPSSHCEQKIVAAFFAFEKKHARLFLPMTKKAQQ